MDLLLVIGGFYVWQCLQYVPPNTAAFIPLVGRYGVTRGGGVRFLNPIPSWVTLFGSRPHIGVPGDDIVVIAPPRFGGFGLQTQRPRVVAPERMDTVQIVDTRVKLGTKTLTQTSSSGEARLVAQRLIQLAKRPPAERYKVLRDALVQSLAPDNCSKDLSHLRRTIRALGWCCNVYALSLLILAPSIVALPFLEDALFLWLAPLIGVLHVMTLIVLFRTHRALFPHERGERMEVMLVSALFPPSLLRTPQRLGCSAVVGYHPALLATLLLDTHSADSFLEREASLSRYHEMLTEEWGTPAWDGQLEGTPVPETEHWSALRERLGLDPAFEIKTRQRSDPDDVAYCPLCDSHFAGEVGICTDCRVPTETYA